MAEVEEEAEVMAPPPPGHLLLPRSPQVEGADADVVTSAAEVEAGAAAEEAMARTTPTTRLLLPLWRGGQDPPTGSSS